MNDFNDCTFLSQSFQDLGCPSNLRPMGLYVGLCDPKDHGDYGTGLLNAIGILKDRFRAEHPRCVVLHIRFFKEPTKGVHPDYYRYTHRLSGDIYQMVSNDLRL